MHAVLRIWIRRVRLVRSSSTKDSKPQGRLLAVVVAFLGNAVFFSACAVIELAVGVSPFVVAVLTAISFLTPVVVLLRR